MFAQSRSKLTKSLVAALSAAILLAFSGVAVASDTSSDDEDFTVSTLVVETTDLGGASDGDGSDEMSPPSGGSADDLALIVDATGEEAETPDGE